MHAWERFLKSLEKEFGIKTVERWVGSLKVEKFDAQNIYLLAKDKFQIQWFEEHIRKIAKKELVNNNSRPIRVHIQLIDAVKKEKRRKKTEKKESPVPSFTPLTLNPHQIFQNFVQSDSNILASKLLCKLAHYDSISKKFIPRSENLMAFNPIYLYGPKGSAKTHMLMATAQALADQNFSVMYVSAEHFTRHFISSIQAGDVTPFRQMYRNIDILLFDDVHALAGKTSTQEEFFHTFNILHLAKKQIILASCFHPSELEHIEPRLVSRFEWGIVLPLGLLSDAERMRMLELRSSTLDFPLNSDISQFLLEQFSSNTDLCQALEALVIRWQKQRSKPSLKQLKKILKDLIARQTRFSYEDIIEAAAVSFDTSMKKLLERTRSREFSFPRQLAIYLCRSELKMSFKRLGLIFNRDHTTILSSFRSIQKRLDAKDKLVEDSLKKILKTLEFAKHVPIDL